MSLCLYPPVFFNLFTDIGDSFSLTTDINRKIEFLKENYVPNILGKKAFYNTLREGEFASFSKRLYNRKRHN